MASSTQAAATVAEPFPIFTVAHKYILYDVDTVSHARAKHNITGVLIGGLPQAPQQNVFSGIPLELMPEEARLLVEKGVAYLVDDAKVHKESMLGNGLAPEERRAFQNALRKQGSAAAKDAERKMEERKKGALEKKFGSSDWNDIPEDMLLSADKRNGKKGKRAGSRTPVAHSAAASGTATPAEEVDNLFTPPVDPAPASGPPKGGLTRTPSAAPSSSDPTPWAVTPATSTPPPEPGATALSGDPSTSRGPFVVPFYTAYPGDPLRFHSHFLCSGMGWEEEFDLLDIVGGGRLGTGVKKGYLIGGQEPHEDDQQKDVRTFCIEWGGDRTTTISLTTMSGPSGPPPSRPPPPPPRPPPPALNPARLGNTLRQPQTLSDVWDPKASRYQFRHSAARPRTMDSEVFATASHAPRRAISSASAHTPARNFSRPSYASSSQQTTPTRPMRRMRSRSVTLGTYAEPSNLPDFPIRWGDEEIHWAEDGSSAETQIHTTPSTSALFQGLMTNPALETTMPQHQQPAKAPQKAAEHETDDEDKAEIDEEEQGEACKNCGSVRRALLKNPLCCSERPKSGKACLKCWRNTLAASLGNRNKEDWMCCVVCGRELLMEDVKRLATKGTVFKYRLKIAKEVLRSSLSLSSSRKSGGEYGGAM
ncbi:hypothetical protein Q7P37_006803 [Cladosporium fusiforme]